MRFRSLLILLLAALSVTVSARNKEQQPPAVLIKALNILQNPGGASLNYKIDVAVFHRQGYVIFKGNKFQRRSKRTIDWFDGSTYWTMNRQTQVVKISNPKRSRRKDEDENASLTEQINKVRDDCLYSMVSDGSDWKITVRAQDKSAKIKNAEIWIDKANNKPTRLRVKLGLIWANIRLWNVTTANYSDVNFSFYPAKYPNAKIIDKREKNSK
ncbi:LolA-like putative outer membrane lipoprotein chaperone [Prevotella sp. KH2C16]|uniref:LolA-like putative outer membrane lipoprotein chaperone n=1 Tax=Prevotella sp. KH2C16 TaxID=1855325 RepID=UPI0008E9713C|nr:LolA-like putative outer membrane lipoprotein chaperone [Prevotella sp. KH2C16]SFG45462.1 Outer membrane lipoprotein carrier protein LolA [Prevotella sp. KH2C16]